MSEQDSGAVLGAEVLRRCPGAQIPVQGLCAGEKLGIHPSFLSRGGNLENSLPILNVNLIMKLVDILSGV
mgnify:CR=1 FL=1